MAVADFVAEAFETDARPGGDRLARRPVLVRSGRGRPARRRSCSATRAGNDGGAAGQTVFADRRARAPVGGAGGGGAGRRRRDPLRRGGRGDHLPRRPRRRASRWRPARRSRAATVVSGLDPKRTLVGARRPGRRSGRRCAGGPATTGRRASSQGQPRRRPAAAVHGRRRRRRARCSAAGSSSRPGSTRSSGRSTREVRPGLRRRRSSRRRSRRSSTRRSSTARRPGPTS